MSPLTKNSSSLRIRFAFGFGLLFTFFLAAALIFIYISFAKFRKDEFYDRLKEKAVTTYKLLIEVDRLDSSLLRAIEKNTPSSAARQVMVFKDSINIYNSSDTNKMVYNRILFDSIKAKGEYFTRQEGNEALGLYMQKKSDRYTILAYGYDRSGFRKINFLKWVMIIVYCVGVVIGWIVTYFFVKKIIRPLDSLKNNLNTINYNSLDIRLPETGQGEEVDSLSANFNQMLVRLDEAFSFQKDFVHYASHELRTPLAAMVGLTESSLNNSKTNEQFQEVLKQLLNQQKSLTDITNSLLLLSGNKVVTHVQEYPSSRIDELVFRSIEIMKEIIPDSEIQVDIEGGWSNENDLLIHANEPLILIAFNNLMKNAIQYSPDKKVNIVIRIDEAEKEVRFSNTGKDFAKDEKEKIFTPFYRATNSSTVKGHGLGLALVKQIAQLHEASVEYNYDHSRNTFRFIFN